MRVLRPSQKVEHFFWDTLYNHYVIILPQKLLSVGTFFLYRVSQKKFPTFWEGRSTLIFGVILKCQGCFGMLSASAFR